MCARVCVQCVRVGGSRGNSVLRQTFPQHLTSPPAVDDFQLVHIPSEVARVPGWTVVWLESGDGELGPGSCLGGGGGQGHPELWLRLWIPFHRDILKSVTSSSDTDTWVPFLGPHFHS